MKHHQAASNLGGVTQAEINEFFETNPVPESRPLDKKGPDFDFSKPMQVWLPGGRTTTVTWSKK